MLAVYNTKHEPLRQGASPATSKGIYYIQDAISLSTKYERRRFYNGHLVSLFLYVSDQDKSKSKSKISKNMKLPAQIRLSPPKITT